jgi:hypothetical protein
VPPHPAKTGFFNQAGGWTLLILTPRVAEIVGSQFEASRAKG